MQQHFFIEGKYLGAAERKFDLLQGSNPLSIVAVCDQCGEAWAKLPVVLDNGTTQPWLPYRMTCRKHSAISHLNVPGSIAMTWDTEFMEALPLAVLRWEFDRELDFERKLKNG